MKSLVIAPTLHSSNWRVFAETLAFIIWVDFTGEICQISWVKSTRFQGEIWVGFHESLVIAPTLHSSNWRVFAEILAFIILGGFHRWTSGWNPPDFTGEIHQISGWNPLDFKGEIPHPAFIKLKSFCWNTFFYNFGWISQVISWWNPPDFTGEICQISWISWNLLDFTWNLPDFTWNLPDFTNFMKSGRFHGEIRQISWWNPLDFMKSIWNPYEICRISWNPYEIRRISNYELLCDDQV